MEKIRLSDPNRPGALFHFSLKQVVCKKDEHGNPIQSECGVIVEGWRWQAEGGGPYNEVYEIKLNSGGTTNWKLIEIVEKPST